MMFEEEWLGPVVQVIDLLSNDTSIIRTTGLGNSVGTESLLPGRAPKSDIHWNDQIRSPLSLIHILQRIRRLLQSLGINEDGFLTLKFIVVGVLLASIEYPTGL